jgi:threonine dehydrogenase-like Zn-dependent dehydrogenase
MNEHKMRAAVLTEPRYFSLREVVRPQPGTQQVCVRMEGCGVCASNLPPWEGKPWFSYPMEPGAPGHEGWGRVQSIGREVTRFSPGDRVGLLSLHGFAEYDVADENAVVKLPKDFDSNPFPAEPLGCAVNVFHRAKIERGKRIAIVGIGFMGAVVLQLAASVGATVIAITRREDTLRFARSYGASECILMDDHVRVIDQVRQITEGRFCDVVIEAAGKQWPLDIAAEITAERGRLIIAGYHQDGPRQVNMQLWNWRGFDVVNAHERDPEFYRQGMQAAAESVATGRLNPAALYTHLYPLDQIGEAFETAMNRPEGFMKALVMF